MDMANRQLAALVMAAAGLLAADRTDGAEYNYTYGYDYGHGHSLYSYEVQVHYTHRNGTVDYWEDVATFGSRADAMDFYYTAREVKLMDGLDAVFPSGKQAFTAEDVRLVRFRVDGSDPWGEEWVHRHYYSYWQSLDPNDDGGGSYYDGYHGSYGYYLY